MTPVQNLPRERFIEMTDGHLSTKASVLGWPAGFLAEEFTIGREGFTRIAAERQPGQPEQRSPCRSRLRNCCIING